MRAPDAFLNPEASMPAVAMKTQHIKVDSHTSDKRPAVLAAFITVLLTFSFLPEIRSQDLFWTGTAANPAVAGSGSWVTPETPGGITWSYFAVRCLRADWVGG